MLTDEPLISNEAFRDGAAITKGILWMSVISFLKSTQVEFSVFVSGVIYVVQRLSAFLLALGVILLMFAQMASDLFRWHWFNRFSEHAGAVNYLTIFVLHTSVLHRLCRDTRLRLQ